MPSTFTTRNRLEKQADGENENTWGIKTRNNLDLVDELVDGYLEKNCAGSSNVTLTSLNAASDESRQRVLKLTGALTGNIDVIVPAVEKSYVVWNATSGGFTLTFKPSSGTGLAIPQGYAGRVFTDGSTMFHAAPWLNPTNGAIALDANGLSRLVSPSNGQVDLYVAGSQRLRATSAEVEMFGRLDMSQERLILDGDDDTYFQASSDDVLMLTVAGASTATWRQGIHLIGKTSSNEANAGIEFNTNGRTVITRDNETPLILERLSTDGVLLAFKQDTALEGTISVSGNTVSYNTFTGGHWAQWAETTEVPRGTLLSTTDEPYEAVDGAAEKPQLVKARITDQPYDSRIYGVFGGMLGPGMFVVNGIGTDLVRVQGPARGGDLIRSSDTPGVAETQPDDIVRSSTVGKLSRGDDRTDERLLPCVLYCG